MSSDLTFASSMQDPNLAAVVAEVESYMKCDDLSLNRNVDDENYLIKLFLVGISEEKEEDSKNSSLLIDQLHSQGNRQVCQYQFKRCRGSSVINLSRFMFSLILTVCLSLSHLLTSGFVRNDIVWICRDCQKDETCVLCNDCFQGSNHEGHDVYFYHSQVGGCW